MNTIFERHSYRGKYLPEPVPRADLTKIMEAGLAAPSGCNKQTTALIGVDDPAVLSGIYAIMEQPFCATAPAVICVLTKRVVAMAGDLPVVQDLCGRLSGSQYDAGGLEGAA